MSRTTQLFLTCLILATPVPGGADTIVDTPARSPEARSLASAAQPDARRHSGISVQQTMASSAPGLGDIKVYGDRVSVSLERASLKAVLTQLATQAGFRLQISPHAGDRHIDARFADLDLLNALRVLLEGTDYVVTLGGAVAEPHSASVQVLSLHPSGPVEGASALEIPDPRALLRAIDPSALPPGVHQDLQTLAAPPDATAIGAIHSQREEIVEQVLDRLAGSIDAATLQDLRRRLSQHRGDTDDSYPAPP